jgi:protein TonB
MQQTRLTPANAMNPALPSFKYTPLSGLQPPARLSPAVFAGVTLVHVMVLMLILNIPSETQPIIPAAPLYVRLIEPTVVPPEPTPVQPRPVVPQPPKLKPVPKPRIQTTTPPTPRPEPIEETRRPDPIEAPRAEPIRVEPQPAPTPAPVEAPKPVPPLPVTQPRFNANYLDNPKPPYPSISRRMGEEGEVQLRVSVDAGGNVQQIEIHRGSGYPRLDQSALQTVRRWRFVPARQGNQPVSSWVIVPIQFSLRS